MGYLSFLKSKIDIAKDTGFDISPEEINPVLLPHQRDAVKWAVKGGRRALFEAFGLGKTVQQLEYCRIVTKYQGGKALIVLPLGVKQEFTKDAIDVLGWSEPPEYVRTTGGRWRSLLLMRTTKGEKIWSINGWCFGPYVLEL